MTTPGFIRAVADFKSAETTGEMRSLSGASERFPLPELLLVGLRKAGIPAYGPDEKIRWWISFQWKGIFGHISLRKFGLHVLISATATLDEEAGFAIALNRLAREAEKLLEQESLIELAAGRVTIGNLYGRIDSSYRYFRGRAKRLFRTKDSSKIVSRDLQELLSAIRKTGSSRRGSYYSIAMLDAYFSRLEHTLVLLYPLMGFSVDKGQLSKFAALDWGDKVMQVLAPKAGEPARLYTQLRSVKERFRNTAAHGGLEKNGRSFWFHVEGVGALPTKLSALKEDHLRRWQAITAEEHDEAIKVLDLFDKLLRTDSRTALPMFYIKSGLDVISSPDWLTKFKAASSSRKKMTSFISRENYQVDRHNNMDY